MHSVQVSNAAATAGASRRANLKSPINGLLLFETVITDLHWTSLQIGMFASLLSACSQPTATWTLRSRRHLVLDNAMIMQLGLRYSEDIGISQDCKIAIEKTYADFAALKKRLDPVVFDLNTYTKMQRQALQADATEWRTLVQTALAALANSEPLIRERLPEAYTSNSGILAAFLKEVLEGRTKRISEFGEMQLPSLTQRRFTPRLPVQQNCDIEIRGRVIPATLNNVSRGGLGIVCNCQFAIDDNVVVLLREGRRLPARVVWQNGQNIGLELAEMLELADPLFAQAGGR